MKFIHTADLHLGYKYSSSFSKDIIEKLTENQKKVFSDIINLANEKNIDALLIAGDLFDSSNPYDELVSFVKKELNRADCKVFIVCGNHDPLVPGSIYNEKFSENVYIFPENITCYSFEEFDVYGSSFTASHKTDNTFSGFKVNNEDKINIMLAHGELSNDSFYNPISISDIEKSGLSYLALGHIHIDDGIKKADATSYGYSGTPQGSTFKETHFAKVIFGEITDSFISTEEISVCRHSFKALDIDISDAETDDEAVKIIKSHLSAFKVTETLFSVTLTGSIKKDFKPDCDYIIKKLEGVMYINIITDLRVKYNIELIKEEKSVRGEFVRNSFKMLEGKDEEYIKKVIEYGVSRL